MKLPNTDGSFDGNIGGIRFGMYARQKEYILHKALVFHDKAFNHKDKNKSDKLSQDTPV